MLMADDGSKGRGVLLVFHGARDDDGMAEFYAFLKLVRAAWKPMPVQPAFLEFVEPSILDAVAEMLAQGIEEILVLPLFLVPASHLKTDVPAAIQHLRLRYPRVVFRYGRHLGITPLLTEMLDERLREVERANRTVDRSETAVQLVGRGSSDPDATSDVAKVARLFWEGRNLATVEIAFAGLTLPSVEAGLTRCLRLGCRTLIVLPYFLFTGILVKRITQQTLEFASRHPNVDIRCGRHLGVHPNLVEALRVRYQELLDGPTAMSCDCCRHRVSLPGFEGEVGLPITTDHHHGLRSRVSDESHGDGSGQSVHQHGPRTRFHHG
ncbi:MAG: sirohydrochlorin chelatase [Nitrospiraceae bacterium]